MNEVIMDHVSKSFGDRTVLQDYSLALSPGGLYCLTGPSGCGKTTVLRLLLGLEMPDAGRVCGVPPRVSCQFQEDRLCPAFSVRSNLRLSRRDVTDGEITRILAALGIPGEEATPCRSLSGGMARRVSLARALLSDAPLLLFDEPFRGLDEAAHNRAAACLVQERAGRTALVITHDPNDAIRLGAILLRFPA